MVQHVLMFLSFLLNGWFVFYWSQRLIESGLDCGSPLGPICGITGAIWIVTTGMARATGIPQGPGQPHSTNVNGAEIENPWVRLY